MNLPAIKPGFTLKGPEPFIGCYNTGHAPLVFRCPTNEAALSGWAWIVCYRDLDLATARRLALLTITQRVTHPTKNNGLRGTVYLFKSKSKALAMFKTFCAANTKAQDGQRAEARRLKELVEKKPGTSEAVEAALKLGDLGVL